MGIGFISALISGIQTTSTILTDFYACFRFIIAFICGAIMASKCKNADKKILNLSKFIIISLSILTFINVFVVNIFETYQVRYIPCQQLFFENPAEFATIIILAMVVFIYANQGNSSTLYLIVGSLCVASTVRWKAIGAIVVIWLIYSFYIKNHTQDLKQF